MCTINCDDSSEEQEVEKRQPGFSEKKQKRDLKVTAEGKNRTKSGSEGTGQHGHSPHGEGAAVSPSKPPT